ncbi:MAG: helix-turn-helix transcriptional regulator [Brachybacterium sp.]|uniref:helix-turn-helix transcriptional regulator n=1 Tax=Brachybacterium sp. TaxID=1891286 RepID=UPI003F8EE74B
MLEPPSGDGDEAGAGDDAGDSMPSGHRLVELAPLVGPLAVIESVRTRPVGPVAFTHAKVVHVMAGSSRIRTVEGERTLRAGDAMVLGGGVWAQAVPSPRVRTWTIYLDQEFLRSHMLWALPGPDRVLPGLHPAEWDGRPLFFHLGTALFARSEPVLRKMSTISHDTGPDAAARLMALFAQTVELALPALVINPATAASRPAANGVVGRLTVVPVTSEALQAATLMREDLARSWRLEEVAAAVALSKSQLTRRFTTEFGAAPMRWLTEVRTTEFARLIEETTLSVDAAARTVGWADRRVAAAWFRRRFGVSPTQFRRQPAPGCIGEAPCMLCPNRHCLRAV